MIGTGHSAAHAVRVLKQRGVPAKDILFLALVAAPEGMQTYQDEHPDVPMFVGALETIWTSTPTSCRGWATRAIGCTAQRTDSRLLRGSIRLPALTTYARGG